MQTRVSALERRIQTSDADISNMADERVTLQGQVEASESQVEDLVRERNAARIQSVANGGQYVQMVSQASRLEAQAAVESRRWKADREEWERERQLLRRLANAVTMDEDGKGHKGASADDAVTLDSTLPFDVRAEMLVLQQTCRSMREALHEALHDVKREGQRLEEFMRDEMVGSARRMVERADHVLERFGLDGLLAPGQDEGAPGLSRAREE